MFADIKKETLIITNNSNREQLLNELSQDTLLHPITFMSLQEFINNYFFSYDEKTIYYLMKKYNYKYDVAKVYLDNLIYIENKSYPSDKLNFLVKLKEELDKENLLIYNELFSYYLQDKDIVSYNIYFDKYIEDIFKRLNVKIINKKLVNKKIDVYEFKSLKEEIRYVFEKISDLINNGINYRSIKLININDDYYNEIERLEDLYNLKINLNNKTYYETEIVQKFINYLTNYSKEESLEKISNEYDMNNKDNANIYNKIINICNRLLFVEEKDIFINMFISIIKTKKIVTNEGIDIININDYIKEDDYVFVLGFNQNTLPMTYKDEGYITDNLKKYVNLYTTVDKNKNEKQQVRTILSNINNIIITYKLTNNKEVCYPSCLLDDDMFEKKEIKSQNNITYSKDYSKLLLGNHLDNLRKYNEKDNDLDVYYNSIKIDYDTYDNTYKQIPKDKLLKYLDDKLLLSYTSMNDYYKCAFRYYLNYILKINKFDDTLQIFIGNLYHYILSICNNDDFDFEKEYNNYLKQRNLTFKERFFVNKLKKELLFIIETIKDQVLLSELKSALYEENIYIKVNDKVTFNGKIDKIMYKEIDGIDYIAVVDYKTGSTDISLDYMDYGIGLQLPVYLYVIKKSNKFKNILFTGFYLQKVLNNQINITKGKSYLDIKKDNLKLIGYSNSDEYILSKFDRSYENSEMIKSMKLTSKGFYQYAKVMSNEEINNLIEKVSEKINYAADNILEARFDINPKIIDNDNIGCKYCKYQDICFVKEEDKVYINREQ